MYEARKAHALESWQRLFDHPEIQMSAPEQYDELWRLSEEHSDEGSSSPEKSSGR